MYDIIQSVIKAGNYKLADIQYKIKKMYLLGDITEDQMSNLLSKAAEGVSTDAERPETLAMMQTLLSKFEALEKRVGKLEVPSGDDESAENPEEPEITEHPAWEPWNGLDDRYQPGSIVAHINKVWESVYPGQNVWEPGTVDERFWVTYTPDDAV